MTRVEMCVAILNLKSLPAGQRELFRERLKWERAIESVVGFVCEKIMGLA